MKKSGFKKCDKVELIFTGICVNEISLKKLDISDDILKCVFNIYWEMARNNDYWQENQALGQYIPFNQALEKWEQKNQQNINVCIEDLEYWLSKT